MQSKKISVNFFSQAETLNEQEVEGEYKKILFTFSVQQMSICFGTTQRPAQTTKRCCGNIDCQCCSQC